MEASLSNLTLKSTHTTVYYLAKRQLLMEYVGGLIVSNLSVASISGLSNKMYTPLRFGPVDFPATRTASILKKCSTLYLCYLL